MPFALAVTMVTAVALSLVILGALGAVLAAWQLYVWSAAGGAPAVAEVWRHSGIAGDYLVQVFAWLPAVLVAAVLFQGAVAGLGLGLLRRRPAARRALIALTLLWVLAVVAVRALVHDALADLALRSIERASFAVAADALATQVMLVMVAAAAALVLLLVQPAVRAQFSAGR